MYMGTETASLRVNLAGVQGLGTSKSITFLPDSRLLLYTVDVRISSFDSPAVDV
jgi:hypothetical protein